MPSITHSAWKERMVPVDLSDEEKYREAGIIRRY